MNIQQSQAEGKKIATPSHLITNVAYKLKHQTRNQYIIARLDTCTDVNIMPASVYKLVFNDPELLKKLATSDLEVGTYTTNTVSIVGSHLFYLVHLDTKKLQEVTFYVAKMMVVYFCPALQHLCLDLCNLAQDWIIYLPELA